MEKTIFDGGVVTKDTSEILKYTFDYDCEDTLAPGVQLTSVGSFAITPTTTPPLTISYQQLVANNRKVELLVGGGVYGKTYTIENTVQTNENPQQTLSPWFKLRIT